MRIFLTDNLKSVPAAELGTFLETVLQQLQDQVNAGPDIASLTQPDSSLPKGMRSGDIVFDIRRGELQAGVYNGKEVLYASFGSFTGTITDGQHGDRSGGTLHPEATTSVAGFMSPGDKTKAEAFKGFLSSNAPVSVTQLPSAGDWCYYTDTTGPTYWLAANFAGAIKSVAMT